MPRIHLLEYNCLYLSNKDFGNGMLYPKTGLYQQQELSQSMTGSNAISVKDYCDNGKKIQQTFINEENAKRTGFATIREAVNEKC